MSAEQLHQNKCSFNFKKPGPGTGREITCCRLNKAAFIEVKTPTYTDGMDVHEAQKLWAAYLRLINPR